MLWGQSLGTGVATTAAAAYLARSSSKEGITLKSETKRLEIKDLLLETLFTSVRSMLVGFYPWKWLTYRYRHSFSWNRWDSRQTLSQIATSWTKPKVPILQAEEDGLVPRAHGNDLQDIGPAGEMDMERAIVEEALHHLVIAKPHGGVAMVDFLREIVEGG